MRTIARIVVAAIVVATAAAGHLYAEEAETVVITLHAKPGAADELEKVIARHWETARSMNLVQESGHLTMRGAEQGGQTYFLEVFAWRDASIPDAAPKEIQSIWADMNRLVEKRGGRPGLGALRGCSGCTGIRPSSHIAPAMAASKMAPVAINPTKVPVVMATARCPPRRGAGASRAGEERQAVRPRARGKRIRGRSRRRGTRIRGRGIRSLPHGLGRCAKPPHRGLR